jgi:putative membrane protein
MPDNSADLPRAQVKLTRKRAQNATRRRAPQEIVNGTRRMDLAGDRYSPAPFGPGGCAPHGAKSCNRNGGMIMSCKYSLPALVSAVSFCFAAAAGAQVTSNTHGSSNVGTAAAPAHNGNAMKSSTSNATSANAMKAPSGNLASSDRKFMEKAAQGGMAEVELGKLATEKAAAPEVKQFGQRMVDDHSKANDELKELASRKGVTLPTSLDKSAQKEHDRLSRMSGADFDREYMKHMVSDHKKDVGEFKSEANKAKDADLEQWAQKTLPTLEEHLKLAQTDETIAKNEAKNGTRTSSRATTNKTGS